MELRIIAITETGKEVLQSNIKASLLTRTGQKFLLKRLGIIKEVEKQEPYTVLMVIKNQQILKFLRIQDFVNRIIEDIGSSAIEDIDYKIVVSNE